MKRLMMMSVLAVVGCKKKEDKAADPALGTAPATAAGTAPGTAPGTATGTAPGTAAATGTTPDVAAADAYALVKPADLKWTPLNPSGPGPEMAVVHGDPMTGGVSAFFLRIPPKGEAGIHTHTSPYRAVLVSGSHKHWLPGEKDVKALSPGSFWIQPGGQPHGDTCEGPDPCVVFIVLDGKFDMAPAPDAKPGDPGAYKLVKAEDLKFGYPDPSQTTGPKFAMLDGDPKVGPVQLELEVSSADAVPVHSHTSAYHGVVLAGAPTHWADGAAGKDDVLAVGTYWYQPGGAFHGDSCTGTAPCKLFIAMPGGMDFNAKP